MQARSFLVVSSLVAALVLGPAHARAQDSAAVSDACCLLVALKVMSLSDAKARTSGRSAMLYYLGRLDGRNEKLDLEPLLMRQLAQMTDADYKAEARRCGERMVLRGRQIFKIGQDMMKHARKQGAAR